MGARKVRWDRRYDWKTLFSKGKFILRKGRDFVCSTASICTQVRNNASAHKVSVALEIAKDEKSVAVTVGKRRNRAKAKTKQRTKVA